MDYRSTKLQTPNPRETSSFKLQEEPRAVRCLWSLRFGASLKFGVWSLVLSSVGLGLQALAADPTPSQLQFFETHVRPVLANNCYKCHSQQSEKVKAGLLLDTREGVLKGGENGPAIVPGDPEKSLLIKAVRYTDPDLQMPPKDKKLSDAEIADLVAWVKMGAPDPRVATAGQKVAAEADKKHWAGQPLTKPAVPEVKDVAGTRTPVDSFILPKLEQTEPKTHPPAHN